jgi:uncharacterized phage infection (PIP) family protein YhgE
MLSSTATSIQDTQPMLEQLQAFMGEKMPDTIQRAANSLRSAQKGAEVVDSAIKSLDTFRTVLSAAPLIGGFVDAPKEAYNPDESLAESLGRLATGLEPLPQTFIDMSTNLDKADDNLATVQTSLTTMSTSVTSISSSLSQYQAMVSQSQASMANLMAMLTNLQNNLNNILNVTALVLSLFFLWLLAAQVVIFSQGWELYRGTAGRMEGGTPQPVPVLSQAPATGTPQTAEAQATETEESQQAAEGEDPPASEA